VHVGKNLATDVFGRRRVVTNLHDLSEVRSAQAALAESTLHYKSVVDGVNNGVVLQKMPSGRSEGILHHVRLTGTYDFDGAPSSTSTGTSRRGIGP